MASTPNFQFPTPKKADLKVRLYRVGGVEATFRSA
jgi:hypothetical protein